MAKACKYCGRYTYCMCELNKKKERQENQFRRWIEYPYIRNDVVGGLLTYHDRLSIGFAMLKNSENGFG